MGKYLPLSEFLKTRTTDSWEPTFEEIEKVLSFKLPPSARKHRAWWANQFKGHHSQAKAWIEAGWKVDPQEIDLSGEVVRFVRTKYAGRKTETSELENLRRKAIQFSGIEDPSKLEEAALNALIRNLAAKALTELGGSDPEACVPERRRAS
jgi:hypothetical protein